jgi:hypothetical protein
MLGESILFSLFTNCLHRADKCGLGVRHDEDEIREQSSGGKFSDRDLHALRYREGMGKRAFPPQGVGTPVFLASGLKANTKSPHSTRAWKDCSSLKGSPDAAGVGRHHGLAGLAAEGAAELGHILHDAIDPETPG